jgi:Plant mobile domain
MQPHNTLHLNAHHPKISYNKQMNLYLHRPNLYLMAIMGDCQLDKSLLTTLVERRRLETSTFHLPVDEMTVTLEDVCYLWRLPIRDTLLFLYIILGFRVEVY